MILMSVIDISILILVLIVVCLLSYNIFFKKDRSHCSGCAMITKAKRRNKKIINLIKK